MKEKLSRAERGKQEFQSALNRVNATGATVDQDRAIEIGMQALAVIPSSDPGRAAILAILGATLQGRYARTWLLADIDQAIGIGEQAAAATPAGDPNGPVVLSNLGIALRNRYERTGAMTDLDRAIEADEQAIASAPASHPDRASFMNNLGLALRNRCVRTGAASDADRAVEASEQAVATLPSGSPYRATFLCNLGIAHRVRFVSSGAIADLDRAIDVSGQAVAAASPGDPYRGRSLATLGAALREKFTTTGTRDYLDRAIEATEQALTATPAADPNHPLILSDLGIAHRARFEYTGARADLDRAIGVSEQAATVLPADHPQRAVCLSTLGTALLTRFDHFGALADLNGAIDVTTQALAAAPADNPAVAAMLSNLGAALGSRFERAGAAADLDRAIDADEQALALTPPGDPARPRRLVNLGVNLSARFGRTGASADLDRAIDADEEAVAATLPGHSDRAAYLCNLGIALRVRFAHGGMAADLDRAIDREEEAVAATPPGHPNRAGYLSSLGAARWTRFERNGATADRDRVLEVAREGTAVVTAPPADRARTARLWGDFAAAAADWDQAVAGYSKAVELLAQVAPRSLGRTDQEYWLGEMAGLAERAAACCLQSGQTDKAVELWEQGRGVLLGQALDTRTDLTLLDKEHQQLADEFRRLRDALSGIAANVEAADPVEPPPSGGAPWAGGIEIERRRGLADQFERLVAEIRSQPGYERFLLPLPTATLLTAADDGPVVLVNVCDIRSDALILTSAGVRVVSLPDLSPQSVRQHVEAFMSALGEVHDPATAADRRVEAEEQISGVLGWLWDAIAGPVLCELAMTETPADGAAWPRVWWCPSGTLALLPLHAAGHHATRFDVAPRTVIDRVVSSYSPTVRALIHSRRPQAPGGERGGGGQLLVVAMPHTPNANDLPGAAEESTLLDTLFSGRTTILSGPQATYDAVTDVLPGYRWAHFACHASSNLADPSASQLLLSDHQRHPLTVLDLVQLRLDEAELAFLSACATARIGTRLPDEAIQFASALQLAGYRHVVATLWAIGDYPAVRIATDVYEALAANGSDQAAVALHQATRRRRGLIARRPSTWAAHVHSGA